MFTKYEILASILQNANSVVVFSGAGMSVPSGIPDFRSSNGLYTKDHKNINPEEILSHHFFYQNVEEFYDFYKTKMMYLNAKPNKAHLFFAKYEKSHPSKQVVVVTQNIDGLHQEAGNKIVYELHGSIKRNYCESCNAFYDENYVYNANGIPKCKKCGSLIKPDVVLYEEGLDEDIISRSIAAISTCEVMLIIGTSLNVYPAAGFLRYFKGKYLVAINKSSTPYDANADLVFNEDIINVVENLEKLM